MKSERRHELQRNALEVEFHKAWEFLRRRGNVLAWVALGVTVVILATVWYVRRAHNETESAQAKFSQLVLSAPTEQRTSQLEAIAGNKSLPLWAGCAGVKLGDDVAFQMLDQWFRVTDADREEMRARAQTAYRKVIADFPKEVVPVAMAHFGLGRLAEDFGETNVAESEYKTILAFGTALNGHPVGILAQQALQRLPMEQGAIYMPASAPATGPSTRESRPFSFPEMPASHPAAPAATEPAAATRNAAADVTAPASAPARATSLAPASMPASAAAEKAKGEPAKAD